MKKVVNILICFVLSYCAYAQYQPLSTAYIYNGISINPGYCGSFNSFAMVLGYRNQWMGLDGSPKTSYLSFHGPLRSENVALGLQFYTDRIGVSSINSFRGNYAYKLRLGSSYINWGLEFGVKQVTNNWSKAEVIQSGDPNFQNTMQRFYLPDFSAGVMYFNNSLQIGLSVKDIIGTQKKISQDLQRKNINFHMSRKFKISKDFDIHPIFLFRYLIPNMTQFDIASQIEWKNTLAFGLAYRFKESYAAYVSYRVNHNLLMTYSYDLPIFSLSNYNTGSHQITIRYNFIYKLKASNPRMF